MDSALATLILTTAVLFGVLTFADSYFTTQDQLWQARSLMELQEEERSTTALEFRQSNVTAAGALVELTFRNVGSSKIADFDQWDLIIQHYNVLGDYTVQWLPYTTGLDPGINQWVVAGIYLSAAEGTAELYEPAILHPGEEIVIQARLVPPIGPSTTNLATLAVASGNHQSVFFTR